MLCDIFNQKVRSSHHLWKNKNKVKINKQSVSIDPTKLFSRLLILSEREGDINSQFKYELTPYPTSLFEDSSMRKANKSQLVQCLFGKEYVIVEEEQLTKTEMVVIDGGFFLHKIDWREKKTFRMIVASYRNSR